MARVKAVTQRQLDKSQKQSKTRNEGESLPPSSKANEAGASSAATNSNGIRKSPSTIAKATATRSNRTGKNPRRTGKKVSRDVIKENREPGVLPTSANRDTRKSSKQKKKSVKRDRPLGNVIKGKTKAIRVVRSRDDKLHYIAEELSDDSYRSSSPEEASDSDYEAPEASSHKRKAGNRSIKSAKAHSATRVTSNQPPKKKVKAEDQVKVEAKVESIPDSQKEEASSSATANTESQLQVRRPLKERKPAKLPKQELASASVQEFLLGVVSGVVPLVLNDIPVSKRPEVQKHFTKLMARLDAKLQTAEIPVIAVKGADDYRKLPNKTNAMQKDIILTDQHLQHLQFTLSSEESRLQQDEEKLAKLKSVKSAAPAAIEMHPLLKGRPLLQKLERKTYHSVSKSQPENTSSEFVERWKTSVCRQLAKIHANGKTAHKELADLSALRDKLRDVYGDERLNS